MSSLKRYCGPCEIVNRSCLATFLSCGVGGFHICGCDLGDWSGDSNVEDFFICCCLKFEFTEASSIISYCCLCPIAYLSGCCCCGLFPLYAGAVHSAFGIDEDFVLGTATSVKIGWQGKTAPESMENLAKLCSPCLCAVYSVINCTSNCIQVVAHENRPSSPHGAFISEVKFDSPVGVGADQKDENHFSSHSSSASSPDS